MAVCDLGIRDLMRSAILGEITTDPRTNGMIEGQAYPANQDRLSALNDLQTRYGANLYRVEPGGQEITLFINISDEAVESFNPANTGRHGTSWQRVTRNDQSEESLDEIASGLRAQIQGDVQKLNDFAESVLLSAKRISTATKDNPGLQEAMSEVWTALKADPDVNAKMRMVAHYISEAKAFMRSTKERLEKMDFTDPDTKDANQLIVFEIEKQVDFYAPMVTEFHNFLSLAPTSNPIRKVIDAAFADLGVVKSMTATVHKDSAMEEVLQILTPGLERSRANMEASIRDLEAKKVGASPRQRIAIDSKISQVRQDFERLAPTKTNIENTLIGKGADSTWVGKVLLAGALNKDLLVQGFMKIIKAKYQQALEAFYPIGAEINNRYQALLDSGFNDGNIDEAFRPLYTDVKEFFYNENTGEIEEGHTAYFTSEQDENWRTEFTELKAKLTKMGRDIQKQRAERATPDELRVLEEQYDKQKTAYIKWRRENFETEYGDRYQAADALLDQVVNYGGKQMSLREIRSSFYDEISRIQETVAALTGVPSPDDIDAMNKARAEFEEIKSVTEKTGEALRIAELFTLHASEMKEMTERWETPASALDKFNLRKAKIDREYEADEITKEERDRWYAANTTTVYDAKYWAERRDTVETLNSIAEEMARITGVTKTTSLKGNYEAMEAICKKYRDYNSFIDGNKLTPAERQTILEIEQEIEFVKQSTKEAYSGFLGAEFNDLFNEMEATRNELSAEIQQLRKDDPTNSPFTKARVAEIRKQLKDLRGNEKKLAAKYLAEKGTSTADIATFQALYDKHRAAIRHLSELTDSTETAYYYDTFQNELNKFVAKKSQAERDTKIARVKKITIGKVKYQKVGDQFFEVLFDGTLSTEEMPSSAILDHLFRKEFEDSKWYQDNHFEAERYDKNTGETATKMIPIYAWRISQPSNKRYIKEHAPNISWKRRVIKDEFRNPAYGTAPDGLPFIKAGLHQNNKYSSLRAENPALWEFRDHMIGVLKDAQSHYPQGKTLGMRVPSIERDNSAFSTIQRGFTGFRQQVSRAWKITPQDQDEGLYAFSDEAGYEKKFIPVRFQNRLEANLISRNIVNTVGEYAAQALQYEARNELLNIGKSIETTLSMQAHAPASESMDKTAKYLGVFKRNKKRGENERLDTVRNMIDMFVYGENMAETSEMGKKIHKTISNLLGIRAGLLFSELPNIASTVVGGAGEIGGTGWSQLVNLIGGETQQIIKTAIKSGVARFSLSDYVWAKGQYAKNSTGFVADIGKVGNRSYWTEFAEFFDTTEGKYVNEFGTQLYHKGLLRQANMSNLAFFKNIVEHELMMTTIMSFAKGYHIDTPGGKVSLKDAFSVEGGKLTPKYDISPEELSNVRGYIAALLRDINGNYGKLDKTMLEQYWFGRTFLFMRKWLIPMVVTRYSGQKYSVEQDRVTRGYIWESMLLGWGAIRGFNETGFRGLGAIIMPEIGVTMTEEEKDALRRTRLEIGMLMLLWVTYRFALGYDDEDKDRFNDLKKESYALQGLTYSLVKAQSEQSTFMPILGIDEGKKLAKNLLSNTMPVVGDLITIVKDDINWHINPMEIEMERYKRDSGTNQKGDMKAVAHLWSLLGLTGSKKDPVEALRALESNLNR